MDEPDQQARKQRHAESIHRLRQKRPLKGVEFYRSRTSNHAPVEKFMRHMGSPWEQGEFQTELDMLGNLGPAAGPTKTKPVRSKIWEWRFDINSCTYRVFYAVDDQRAVLLHAVVKAKKGLLQQNIETALNRWNDYLSQKQRQMPKGVKT